MEPKVVGQSGTERPASLLVTRAPAIIRRKVAQAVKTAKRWCARLYGAARDFRDYSLVRCVTRAQQRGRDAPGKMPALHVSGPDLAAHSQVNSLSDYMLAAAAPPAL